MKRYCFAKRMFGLLTSVTCLSLLATSSLSQAAHPQSPPPCAADGTCRPNVRTWGVWETRWRPWPGDPALDGPAAKDLQPEPAGDEGLKGLERPEPAKEDRAGPEKQEREAGDAIDGGLDGGINDGLGIPAGPGGPAEPLPGLDPLGLRMPGSVDLQAALPPALPSELLRFSNPAAVGVLTAQATQDASVLPTSYQGQTQTAAQSHNPGATQRHDAPPTMPRSLQRVAQLTGMLEPLPPVNRPVSDLRIRTDSAVQQTSAQAIGTELIGGEQSGGIRIINPAAALATEPGKTGLQQAIYFESSQEKK